MQPKHADAALPRWAWLQSDSENAQAERCWTNSVHEASRFTLTSARGTSKRNWQGTPSIYCQCDEHEAMRHAAIWLAQNEPVLIISCTRCSIGTTW
jgi:5-methylcytosine-specific restriction endonuclease McrA